MNVQYKYLYDSKDDITIVDEAPVRLPENSIPMDNAAHVPNPINHSAIIMNNPSQVEEPAAKLSISNVNIALSIT